MNVKIHVFEENVSKLVPTLHLFDEKLPTSLNRW